MKTRNVLRKFFLACTTLACCTGLFLSAQATGPSANIKIQQITEEGGSAITKTLPTVGEATKYAMQHGKTYTIYVQAENTGSEQLDLTGFDLHVNIDTTKLTIVEVTDALANATKNPIDENGGFTYTGSLSHAVTDASGVRDLGTIVVKATDVAEDKDNLTVAFTGSTLSYDNGAVLSATNNLTMEDAPFQYAYTHKLYFHPNAANAKLDKDSFTANYALTKPNGDALDAGDTADGTYYSIQIGHNKTIAGTPVAVRPGYTFQGWWRVNNDGTLGDQYDTTGGNTAKTITAEDEGVTLVAKWTVKNDYNVYLSNTGTYTDVTYNEVAIGEKTLPESWDGKTNEKILFGYNATTGITSELSDKLVRPGYTLTGWKVKAVDPIHNNHWVDETIYTNAQTQGFTGDVLLEPQWEETTYKVTYTVTTNQGMTVTSTQNFKKDTDIITDGNFSDPTSANTPVGYKFKGWKILTIGTETDSTTPKGNWATSGQVVDFVPVGESGTHFNTTGKYGNVAIKAIYEPKQYTVTILDSGVSAATFYTNLKYPDNEGTAFGSSAGTYTGTFDLTHGAVPSPSNPTAQAGLTFDHYEVVYPASATTEEQKIAAYQNTNWKAGEIYTVNAVGKYGDVTLKAVYHLDAKIAVADYGYGKVKGSANPYVLVAVGFKHLNNNQIVYNDGASGYALNSTSNTKYLDLLKKQTGDNTYIQEQCFVTLIKVDHDLLKGCTAGTNAASPDTINDMQVFKASLLSRLTTNNAATEELTQNGDANGNSTADIGDIGTIARMLETSDYYDDSDASTGVTRDRRLQADADSDDDDRAFASIKDVVYVIDEMYPTNNP